MRVYNAGGFSFNLNGRGAAARGLPKGERLIKNPEMNFLPDVYIEVHRGVPRQSAISRAHRTLTIHRARAQSISDASLT